MFQLSHSEQVRVGVVGNISACHADAPGSIPGHGVPNFLSDESSTNGLQAPMSSVVVV